MITAIDTNVLFDLFRTDLPHHFQARRSLKTAYDAEDLIICDVVYAELVPAFANRFELDDALSQLGVSPSSINIAVAYEAGRRRQQYRRSGGPRTRIITDFLIGAYALAAADYFLTRDRGFFNTYFPELRGIEVT